MNIKSILYLFFVLSSFIYSQENVNVLGSLPESVSETSGLVFYNGKLITHNDSGNTPELFEIDTTSYQITRTITVANVENIDWEDLAQDDQYIYIGDFGNNIGIRTDLSIYRIAKQDYDQSDSVMAEQISFVYEDQTDFSDMGTSDWDAEALFVLNDKLVILTKQWKSGGTVAYVLTKAIGDQIAQRIDFYQIDGLVTGASYNPDSELLMVIGYSSTLSPFVVQFENSTATNIFTDALVKTNLSIGLAQVESITYGDNNTYFFTSEFFSRTNPSITLASQLFTFDLNEDEEPEPKPEPEPEPEPEPPPGEENQEIIIFQRAGYELVEYNLNSDDRLFGVGIYDTSGRQVFYITGAEIMENAIDLSTLNNAVYYLTFYFDDRIESIPFFRN